MKGTIAATTPNGSFTVKLTWCSKPGRDGGAARVAPDLGVVVEAGGRPLDLVEVLDHRLAALERHQSRRARDAALADARGDLVQQPRLLGSGQPPPGRLRAPGAATARATSAACARGTSATISSVAGFSTGMVAPSAALRPRWSIHMPTARSCAPPYYDLAGLRTRGPCQSVGRRLQVHEADAAAQVVVDRLEHAAPRAATAGPSR